MGHSILYICYYNVGEPLVRTQVIAYLRWLAAAGFRVHLLTFEAQRLTRRERRAFRDELAAAGIHWHALRYHRRPSLPATLYDIAAGTAAAACICRRFGVGLVHARSHVPAAMALLLKRFLGVRFLFDLRGLLAEEYADAGHWKVGGLKYRLTKRMEREFFRTADAVVMLTHRIKGELVPAHPALQREAADVEVIPCCVDTDAFSARPEARAAYRRLRGWTDRRVLTYVGKLGTWYLPEEMARFFSLAHREDHRLFFQVVTQSDPAPMLRALRDAGLPPDSYDLRSESPHCLPELLTAADAGISFIRPVGSKRASSPTKIGEYLAAGLPLVANAGIGDCDEWIEGRRLGVVIRAFADPDYRRAAQGLRDLVEDPDAPDRCRRFAAHELSLAGVGGPRYGAVYRRLLAR